MFARLVTQRAKGTIHGEQARMRPRFKRVGR